MRTEHWAYQYAERIIQECGDKDTYICASGITPSGTVHIGNFREVISVELVVRALRDMGKAAKFLYFWDDYDVFRKCPKDMPENYNDYLGYPICAVPDPAGKEISFAAANARRFADCLPAVGISADFIHQSQCYQKSQYAEEIRIALAARKEIQTLLNRFRTEALSKQWWPISVYSSFSSTDRTEILDWDGAWIVRYRCSDSGKEEDLDIRNSGQVKLSWRVDWPMRWKHYGVDFEPAGKDHHSDGGSFSTAELIAQEIFNYKAPVTFQYDFVRIKGRGGKMSSSSGENIALDEVLRVYQPELVRYLFAGTRPNREFSVSFDLDVIKLYEDYDRCERDYFAAEDKQSRIAGIYYLSQVESISGRLPLQLPFRHLCNMVQITGGSAAALAYYYPEVRGQRRAQTRASCAEQWINSYAPKEFRFQLRSPHAPPAELSDKQKEALALIADAIDSGGVAFTEEGIGTLIKNTAQQGELELREVFSTVYTALISQERGPRLASFMIQVGKEAVLERIRLK